MSRGCRQPTDVVLTNMRILSTVLIPAARPQHHCDFATHRPRAVVISRGEGGVLMNADTQGVQLQDACIELSRMSGQSGNGDGSLARRSAIPAALSSWMK